MGKVLHASASGYFPFCITPASTIPERLVGSWYPLALTLDQIVSLFWRVKKWTYEDNQGPVGESFQFFDPITNEENIVCNPSLYSYFRDFPSGSTISIFELFRPLNQDVLKVGNLYYPYVFFEGRVPLDSGTDYFTANDSYGVDIGIFTISWLGYNVSTPLYGLEREIRYNAKFTATEYWSYGGTYDTSTGAPL